ncbi:MAG: DUF362 domain-containing protein [Clostridia bacterium]|nr:DUF362 domain-containing protein [Clostridia bacterium]
MTASKVYFTDMRARNGESLPQKLLRLIRAAGMETMDFEGCFTAIKMHFGEPGNLSGLRPNFARTVACAVLARGGRPFLTDCNTLYVGERSNALDHLGAAAVNGFFYESCGCRVVIADGLKGTDETLVPLENTKHVREAKIGRAIMDADIFLSLNHFKGHEATGFGGALKNIGMGCGSRAGKMEQHCSGKPEVDEAACRRCRRCADQCAHGAIGFDAGPARIDHARCVGCGRCIGACNFHAIDNLSDSGNVILCEKIAEYALAVLRGRPHFHISIINQVSPYCDCHAENDLPIIPDVGMLASFDPVALDQACADLCNAQQPVPGSLLAERRAAGGCEDHFTCVFPETNWRVTLRHAEALGIGTTRYELITMR